MRIIRDGDNYRDGKPILNCQVYVRANFEVAMASEWYYDYVAENSYLPICDLLPQEDAQILKEALENLEEPVELYTHICNRRQEGFRNVYLRLESCEKTENGKPLYKITLHDVLNLQDHLEFVENKIFKYRYFMTLKDEYYFEYTPGDNMIVVYKYVNARAIDVHRSTLEEFVQKYKDASGGLQGQENQMKIFCSYLRGKKHSFEMNFTMRYEDGSCGGCGVKGGMLYQGSDMVAGVFNPEFKESSEIYYLSTAAKDAGTGLLNKKAATEYAIERIRQSEGRNCWLLIMDIDDFKNINDSFGHLFGDQVIRGVADTLRHHVYERGVVGRFGGDEFFVLVDQMENIEELKTLLKTMVKEIGCAFDPQVKVTLSIGISQYPEDGTDFAELFGKADKALYIAKDKGKNRHIIYDESKHGAYAADNLQNQIVEYALSKEKRRKAFLDILQNIYVKGAAYVTQQPKVQRNICSLFDLDGFTVYGDGGRKVLCRSGNYVCPAPDANGELADEAYVELFGKEDLLVLNGILKLSSLHPAAYEAARKQEIGATLRCMGRHKGTPYAMVHFDVFNCNRKWSETDIEMLSAIGYSLCRQLKP